MLGEIVLRFAEHPPVTVTFLATEVVVCDGEAAGADVVVIGRLTDVARLLAAPGLRSALGALATRRVTITGRRMLARRFLALLALDD